MDLGLYASVLWRFRWIVVIGTILAVVLTVLSVAKMTSSGLEYREPETWQAESQVVAYATWVSRGARALSQSRNSAAPRSKRLRRRRPLCQPNRSLLAVRTER